VGEEEAEAGRVGDAGGEVEAVVVVRDGVA